MDCVSPLDFDELKKEFGIHANEFGMNLEKRLEAAGRHFTSDEIKPYSKTLTIEEIDALIEDDEAFLKS